jgi:hypothetical protein
MRISFVFLILGTMLLAACATVTEPSATWRDPAYQAHPEKVMVVGVARSAVNRRIFEDEFVRQLQERGVKAIASYTVLPDELQNNRKAIADKVAELGADTVLITRLAGKKTVQTYVPGTPYYPPPNYGKWPDYYGYGYDALYSPGFVVENELAVVESNLYDASNDNLIWASTTEMGTYGTIRERIRNYIGIVIKAMVAQGVLY